MLTWAVEPWELNENLEIVDRDGSVIASLLNYAGEVDKRGIRTDGRRIVACVNACAGVEDPAAAIQAAREALAEFVDMTGPMGGRFFFPEQRDKALAALLKLGGPPK